MTTETKQRSESVSKKTIIEAVIRGAKENKSNEQVADEIGMKPNSFTSRLSQIRSDLKKETNNQFVLPYLSKRSAGESTSDLAEYAKGLMAQLGVNNSEAKAKTPDDSSDQQEYEDVDDSNEEMELSEES